MTQPDPSTPAASNGPSGSFGRLPYFIVASILTFVAIVFGGKACAAKQDRELLAQGTAATATIVKLTDTGNRYNRDPEILVTLVVQPEQGEPWQAEVKRVMSVIDAPVYQVGVVVDVKFDPSDPSRVAIIGPAASAPAAPPVPAAAP